MRDTLSLAAPLTSQHNSGTQCGAASFHGPGHRGWVDQGSGGNGVGQTQGYAGYPSSVGGGSSSGALPGSCPYGPARLCEQCRSATRTLLGALLSNVASNDKPHDKCVTITLPSEPTADKLREWLSEITERVIGMRSVSILITHWRGSPKLRSSAMISSVVPASTLCWTLALRRPSGSVSRRS